MPSGQTAAKVIIFGETLFNPVYLYWFYVFKKNFLLPQIIRATIRSVESAG